MHTSLAVAHTSDLWAAALERLEPRYNKPVFEMWLKPMRLVELTPDGIVLAVNTSFARDWVENRLKADITAVLHEILGAEIALRVVVDPSSGTESVPTAVPARPVAVATNCASATSTRATPSTISWSVIRTASLTPPRKRSRKLRRWRTTRSFCTAASVSARPT